MSSWTRFVERAPACSHAVQIYGQDAELVATLASYVDRGLRSGSPAFVVATAEHRRQLEQALVDRGVAADRLARDGLLVHADAQQTLSLLLGGSRLSRERFDDVVGAPIRDLRRAFPGRTVRVFGELVDLLWRDRQEDAALELEGFWNGLAAEESFALLCAYRLDILDLDVQSRSLPDVLHVHSHARAVADPSRFSAVVDRALSDLVGPAHAARIYLDVADHVPHDDLPRGQALLMWLSRHERPLARQVLGHVRAQLSPAA